MIKPLLDNILIEPEAAETKTAGGIYVPETAKEKPSIGTVLASNTKGITSGERVVYKKWTSNELKYEGKEYVIVDKKDILAIIK